MVGDLGRWKEKEKCKGEEGAGRREEGGKEEGVWEIIVLSLSKVKRS